MIFFEEDNKKKSALFVLVAITTLFIVFQYSKMNVFDGISSDQETDRYWSDLGLVLSKTGSDIQNNFEETKDNFEILKEDKEIERRQAILLEITKDVLENKNTTSTANATSTE